MPVETEKKIDPVGLLIQLGMIPNWAERLFRIVDLVKKLRKAVYALQEKTKKKPWDKLGSYLELQGGFFISTFRLVRVHNIPTLLSGVECDEAVHSLW